MPQEQREYIESLIHFLEEKEREYQASGTTPFLRTVIDELHASLNL